MNSLDFTIWIATLGVVAFVVVPVAVTYLRRALAAARAIERNLADMLEAGAKIADHTGAIPTLDQTIGVAVGMKPVAQAIEAKAGAVASLLATRAAKGG